MKKEILEALTGKFPGVSASVLERIAGKLAKTVSSPEQVKEAVDGVSIQQVIDSYTDSRVTEASETARRNAVADYESRHGLKEGKPQTGQAGAQVDATAAQQTKGGEEAPAWAQQLIARMDKLEATRTTDSRRQQLEAVMGQLPEGVRKLYGMLPLDKYTDTEFEKMLSEVKTTAESMGQQTAAKGGVFGKPTAPGGARPKEELTEAQVKAITQRGEAPGEGQPF